MEEIAHAKIYNSLVAEKEWKGLNQDGLIEILMFLKTDREIISAFPQF